MTATLEQQLSAAPTANAALRNDVQRVTTEAEGLRERVCVLEGVLVTIERRLREDAAPLVALVSAHGTAPEREAWKAVYSSAVHAQGVIDAALAPARDGGAVEAP